jgi:hypothetical protein
VRVVMGHDESWFAGAPIGRQKLASKSHAAASCWTSEAQIIFNVESNATMLSLQISIYNVPFVFAFW